MVRPILFNGEMVRAIMEGRKTVTRRKIDIDISNQFDVEVDGSVICYIDPETGDRYKPDELCRYHPGDVMYVRETWGIANLDYDDKKAYIVYKTGDEKKNGNCVVLPNEKFEKLYESMAGNNPDWHPSIHMPKEAARIWLKVTDVRAERLQDISVPSMIKEGVRAFGCEPCLELNERCKPQTSEDGFCGAEDQVEDIFSDLWDSTTKKSDLARYGWDANPWVWVIEFERCEKPEPCILRGVEPAEEKRPCIGYGDAWADEPCEMCKGCSQCTGNDKGAEG